VFTDHRAGRGRLESLPVAPAWYSRPARRLAQDPLPQAAAAAILTDDGY
jgi:hypothetical protein